MYTSMFLSYIVDRVGFSTTCFSILCSDVINNYYIITVIIPWCAILSFLNYDAFEYNQWCDRILLFGEFHFIYPTFVFTTSISIMKK